MGDGLSGTTSIFGLHLWAVVGICVGAAIVLLLFFISLWLASRRSKAGKGGSSTKPTIPAVSKEIQEIQIHQTQVQPNQLFPDPPDPLPEEEGPVGYNRINIEIGKDHRIAYPDRYYGGSSSHGSGEAPRSGGGGGGGSGSDQPGQVVLFFTFPEFLLLCVGRSIIF